MASKFFKISYQNSGRKSIIIRQKSRTYHIFMKRMNFGLNFDFHKENFRCRLISESEYLQKWWNNKFLKCLSEFPLVLLVTNTLLALSWNFRLLIVIKKIFEAVTYQNNYGEIAKGTLAKLSSQIGRNKEMPKDFTMGPNISWKYQLYFHTFSIKWKTLRFWINFGIEIEAIRANVS